MYHHLRRQMTRLDPIPIYEPYNNTRFLVRTVIPMKYNMYDPPSPFISTFIVILAKYVVSSLVMRVI